MDLTEARVSKVMKCNNCSASFDEEKLLGILMSKTVRGISARDSSPFLLCVLHVMQKLSGTARVLVVTYIKPICFWCKRNDML